MRLAASFHDFQRGNSMLILSSFVRAMCPRRLVIAALVIAALAGASALAGAAAAADAAAADAGGGSHLVADWHLGGAGGWDLPTIDPAARRLYIARSTRVMVVQADTGRLIGEIPGHGVHGVAVVPAVHRGFIADGPDDAVTIFDLGTLAVIGRVATGIKPDPIVFDPVSGHGFVCDNGGTTLIVLDLARARSSRPSRSEAPRSPSPWMAPAGSPPTWRTRMPWA
jgi:hypothetical protein